MPLGWDRSLLAIYDKFTGRIYQLTYHSFVAGETLPPQPGLMRPDDAVLEIDEATFNSVVGSIDDHEVVKDSERNKVIQRRWA